MYRVFDQVSMGTRSAERLQIEADLRKGLERRELEVHYQPFYSLDGQQIVGAEALVRWRHPVNGLISPMTFIPMAEESGLILPIGRFVLEQACRQVRSIRDRLGVDLPISVNLSPRQFQESGLLAQVAAALDASGLPPAVADVRDHRVHGHGRPGRRARDHEEAEPARRAPGHRRLRHRPLVAGLPEAVPGARGEGGPGVRAGASPRPASTPAIVRAVIELAQRHRHIERWPRASRPWPR